MVKHALHEHTYPGIGSDLDKMTKQAWSWYQSAQLPAANLFGCSCK